MAGRRARAASFDPGGPGRSQTAGPATGSKEDGGGRSHSGTGGGGDLPPYTRRRPAVSRNWDCSAEYGPLHSRPEDGPLSIWDSIAVLYPRAVGHAFDHSLLQHHRERRPVRL